MPGNQSFADDTDVDGIEDSTPSPLETTVTITTSADSTPPYDAYADPSADPDSDGLYNWEEDAASTAKSNADTDGDGLNDGDEVHSYRTNPLDTDSDDNGWSDYQQCYPLADPDGDRLENALEWQYGSNPYLVDTDYDLLTDNDEVRSGMYSPTVADTDGNGWSDYFEYFGLQLPGADPDRDGLSNADEAAWQTQALNADTDGDGLNDGLEAGTRNYNPTFADTDGDGASDFDEYFAPVEIAASSDSSSAADNTRASDAASSGSTTSIPDSSSSTAATDATSPADGPTSGSGDATTIAADSGSDGDQDGLTLAQEQAISTDPADEDTDDDGLNDGQEVALGANPLLADSDADTIGDFDEATSGLSSPNLADTDGDGLRDDAELSRGTNPNLNDSDGDGLLDGPEVEAGLDPKKQDTDGDFLTDFEEGIGGAFPTMNPLSNDTDGDGTLDYLEVQLTDTDGGGIPDRIELFYGMDVQTAYDDVSGDLDGDGITNLVSYLGSFDLRAGYDGRYDRDADRMTDAWEFAHGLNMNDPYDGTGDPDSDGVFNFEEFQRNSDPQVSDLAAIGSSTPASVETSVAGSPPAEGTTTMGSGASNPDWDGDGVGNFTEVYVDATDPRTPPASGEPIPGDEPAQGSEDACPNPNCRCENCVCANPTSDGEDSVCGCNFPSDLVPAGSVATKDDEYLYHVYEHVETSWIPDWVPDWVKEAADVVKAALGLTKVVGNAMDGAEAAIEATDLITGPTAPDAPLPDNGTAPLDTDPKDITERIPEEPISGISTTWELKSFTPGTWSPRDPYDPKYHITGTTVVETSNDLTGSVEDSDSTMLQPGTMRVVRKTIRHTVTYETR